MADVGASAIDVPLRPICECRGTDDHPIKAAASDDLLLRLLVREDVPQEQGNGNLARRDAEPLHKT